MLNPIISSKNITDEFISYISTRFHISDQEYRKLFEDELANYGNVAKGPYLDITDSFESGMSISQLIEQGEMSPLFKELEPNILEVEKEIKLERPLYLHQEKAIRKTNVNHNLVVTTGTGSGKTECFILPILNHLLREKETGALTSGVRAILIYPMNALANDQMKRLRSILANYSSITFGVYNSSTKQEDSEGIEAYGKIYKDENGNALKPLPNELISRKTMQRTPPHILVTNYAMLEYMLLRPNDDHVFSGSNLKYIVLDEAHTYRGATGIETSLLLRRLKARVSNSKNTLHILTSATLGGEDANKDIIHFANTLCDAEFLEEDIIRSHTVMPSFPEETVNYPLALFKEIAEEEHPLDYILDKYNISYNQEAHDEEILFDLCLSSSFYKELRNYITKPLTIKELTNSICESMPVTESDVVNLINVASRAVKNKTALIKARYHMFMRALEGFYITLGATKKVFLRRTKFTQIGNDKYRVFEAVVCDDCGRIGIVGKEINGVLEFESNRWNKNKDIYLINDDDSWSIDDEEDVNDGYIESNDYIICIKCGKILHESQKNEFDCNCGDDSKIKVRKANPKGIHGDYSCPCCHSGTLKTFYLGYDAATAVLGTELFEQLPDKVALPRNIVEVNKEPDEFDDLFSNDIIGTPVTEKKSVPRQFLSFSDSRSDAAFFACYMTNFYNEFLRRRGIWHVINKNINDIKKEPWEIKDLVDELTGYFSENRSFSFAEETGTENIKIRCRRQAWIAVLNEMTNARRSTSLVSLGILDFTYQGLPETIMEKIALKYDKPVEDVKNLFQLLIKDIVYFGAVKSKDTNLKPDDREYIYYTSVQKKVVKCKKDIHKGKTSITSWLPLQRSNGSYYYNARVQRTMRVLNIEENKAIRLLEGFWDKVLTKGTYSFELDSDGEYYIPVERFKIIAGDDENLPIFICQKCGRTTMHNCQNMCTSVKCDGTLIKISRSDLLDNNHYAKLYSNQQMQPLQIKEHTAQLGREEQEHYQEMFINKKINALSCSTTFEMGVDVGDLETVFLRDMPPTPANYVQRAGRAGRSLHSAAYALTYAKLSSHDFTYYDKPERMISGKIGVPLFSLSNKKVVRRHIFAVALSDFFSNNEDVYNENNADVLLNSDGYERFVSYLNEKPKELYNILHDSIPNNLHEKMGLNDWSWINSLIGDNGVLTIAVKDFRDTVTWYKQEIEKNREIDIEQANKFQRLLKKFRRSFILGDTENSKYKNELIEFLVRNNVLPKYGFPVDTVELYQGLTNTQSKKLQLVRDLQLAIAEYAPDAQVVADGKLYTSRYIRKLPKSTGQDWEDVYIAECKDKACSTWNYLRTEPSNEEHCISCDGIIEKSRWMKAIEPRKGFISEEPQDVPSKKPDRSFRSDDYYIGDPQRQVTDKQQFTLAGHILEIETSTNDSLMVVCKDDFFVCDFCGYSVSHISLPKKDGSPYNRTLRKKHMSPWGKDCNGILQKKKLCHVFKTDVVKIFFGDSSSKNKATMLSTMYALLEAMSDVLDIERTDIKGCLYKIRYNNSMAYTIILYDAVPGGAGHVRRIVTPDGEVLKKIINKAISITNDCTCDPSCYNCIRNYYNQNVHDLLDRKLAYDFLIRFQEKE